MFDKIKKIPFLEFLLFLLVNICAWIVLLIGILYLSFYEAVPKDHLLIGYLSFFVVCIIIPLILYFTLFYLSQNKFYLLLSSKINKNIVIKLLLCLIIFIISPLQISEISVNCYDLNLLFNCLMGSIREFVFNYIYSLALPLTLFFIFEPVITKCIDKYFKKRLNSKTWLKKNYDLRMEIEKELSLNS